MKRTLSLLALGLMLTACGGAGTQTATPSPTSATPTTTAPSVPLPSPVPTPVPTPAPTPVAAPPAPSLPTDPYAQTKPPGQPGPTPAPSADAYNITLNFAPGSDPRVIDAMKAAASRWEGVMTQGLPDVTASVPANACGSNAAYAGTVDDVLVFTGSKGIDGPGGVLAQSGPCSIRSASGLTVYATLVFDSADLNSFSGQLPDIALHELGHSLGIGSLWKKKGLLTGSGTTDPRFTGQNAGREYAALGGTLGTVPVENQGGSGTADSHWREKSFGNELMTGYLNSGSNPLSRLTIASLQDLGYSVDYTRADAFSVGTVNSLSLSPALDMGAHEEVIEPQYQVE